jgi:hypothetical protein
MVRGESVRVMVLAALGAAALALLAGGCDSGGRDDPAAPGDARDGDGWLGPDGGPDGRADARGDLGGDSEGPAPPEWQEPVGALLPSGSEITPAAGGTVTSDDGTVLVSFPPGAVAQPTTVTLGALTLPGPAGVSDLGLAVDVDARAPDGQPVTRLAGSASLYFRHGALDPLPPGAAAAVVYAHEASGGDGANGGAWTALATVRSPAQDTAMARTDHLSGFGLYAPALTGALGCRPGGGCLTTIGESNPIASMGMDGQGNLYFIHPNGPYIYRLPAGGGPADVHIFFDATDAYPGTWLYANRIAVSDRSGDVFLLRNERVFRIRPDGAWSPLYPGDEGEADVRVHAVRFHSADGALWVQCRDDFRTDTLRRIDPEGGQVLATVQFNSVRSLWSSETAWTFDAAGRLFALRGWGLYVLDDPTGDAAAPWTVVAEGWQSSRYSLTADAHGNVFVGAGAALCPAGSSCVPTDEAPWDQVAVVSGTPPFPNERIAGLRDPSLVVVAAGRLLVSSGAAIVTLPLSRRDALDGSAAGVISPSVGDLSGRGSFVTLTGLLASSPAHHAVWVSGVRLPLAQVLPGELRFTLPSFDHRWEVAQPWLPDLGRGVRLTLPSGPVAVRVGPDSRTLGELQTPEPGRYKPTTYNQSNGSGTCLPAPPGARQPPLEVAVGEWVYWHAPFFAGGLPENRSWSVSSRDGLFPAWDADRDGPWMAWRSERPGDYTFDWIQGDQTLPCTIRVSAGGAPDYVTDLRVDPAAGGTFFSNGARMVIPPGALPGGETVELRLTTANVPPPPSDVRSPASPPGRYRQFYRFTPEPDHLSADVRFGVPLGHGDDPPTPAFFDDGAAADVPDAYRQSMYVPIEHRIDGSAGYVDVVLAAGDYGPRAASRARRAPAGGQRWKALDAVSWLGHRISQVGVNQIGGYLWWKVGLPNEKIEDGHFTVLFNTRAGVTADKALAAHEGLSMARTRFATWGYAVPDWVIVTLDPDLDSEGSTSGLGRLAHWNMALGAWQADDDLRSAAAHELFHVIQYENMSYAARAKKKLWDWWMEGTAVWAEEVLFPGENSAADWVRQGADFIHQGLSNYGSLTDAQEYACVALVTYLEQEHPGAVLEILQALGVLTSPADALRTKVGSMATFLDGFARSYFGGLGEPFASWDRSRAFLPPRVLSEPATPLVDRGLPPESAVAVRAATDPARAVPVSFDEASGSVVRADHRAMLQTTVVLDRAGTVLGTVVGTTRPEGVVLAKAATFGPTNPLTVIHVNGEYEAPARNPSVAFEVPTLDTVSPATFSYQGPVTLTLRGGGFGPGAVGGALRRVLVFYGEREATAWDPETITVSLPANSVTPMTVPIQVRTAAGVVSNTRTVEATD